MRTGAFLVEMPPEEHDAVVALTSHLPQLISTSLATDTWQPTRIPTLLKSTAQACST